MSDLVLDIGIAADICLERGTHFAAALAAFEKAKNGRREDLVIHRQCAGIAIRAGQ
jgi:hypothetical protein